MMKSGKSFFLTGMLAALLVFFTAMPAAADSETPAVTIADGDYNEQQLPTILPPL